MKIGIMSMQRIINYGSFLQAYGLKRVIEDLGHDVQFVDYRTEKSLVKNEAQIHMNKLIRVIKMLSPKYRSWRRKQIKLNSTFTDFIRVFKKEYLPMLGMAPELNYSPELDVLVVGSDEVFNCTQSGCEVGYSKQLFGEEQNAKKIISYAASFGNTTYEKLKDYNIDREVGTYLHNFNALSVRDNNSSEIIKTLIDVLPKKHIDPVLLYGFPEVNDISIELKDYIVVYAYADRITEEESRQIRAFAKKHDKKIVSLGFYQPFCDMWIQASPFEVLAYIKHADYIITDTFHGAVFSIKYQKKFGVIIRDSNRQKLQDLLKEFNVQDRQILDLYNLGVVVEKELNSSDICKRIKENQIKAMDYLSYNLSI